MNFTQMEYFIAVASQLNFTAAAKELYISQPALSKQIALLEEELNTKLFVRNSRNVALTKAGLQLQEDITKINDLVEQTKLRVIKAGEEDKKVFRIACFDGVVTEDFLHRFYEQIHHSYPTVHISLVRGSFKAVLQELKKGNVDLLITMQLEADFDEGYEMKVIAEREAAIIYSDKMPQAGKINLTPKFFSGETYLMLSHSIAPNLGNMAIQQLERLGIEGVKIEEYDNLMSIISNLQMGHGFTILSKEVAVYKTGLRSLKIQDEEDCKTAGIVAVWKKENKTAEKYMAQIKSTSFFQN